MYLFSPTGVTQHVKFAVYPKIPAGNQVMEEADNDAIADFSLLTRLEAEVATCRNEGLSNK